MSMLYSNIQKTLPQTPDDCIKTDKVSSELWTLAEIIESWGKIIFIVLTVIGIILTITVTATVADVIGESLAFPAFLISIVIFELPAFFEYCIYHILALYTGANASVVQNTKIAADVALLQLTKGNTFKSPGEEAPYSSPYPDGWFCRYCGTPNKKEYGQCKKCGKFRSSWWTKRACCKMRKRSYRIRRGDYSVARGRTQWPPLHPQDVDIYIVIGRVACSTPFLCRPAGMPMSLS